MIKYVLLSVFMIIMSGCVLYSSREEHKVSEEDRENSISVGYFGDTSGEKRLIYIKDKTKPITLAISGSRTVNESLRYEYSIKATFLQGKWDIEGANNKAVNVTPDKDGLVVKCGNETDPDYVVEIRFSDDSTQRGSEISAYGFKAKIH